jgi:hypothetical protein
MVGDGRWRDAASFPAEPTQRLDTQLMRIKPAISARRSKDPEAVSSLAVRC